MTMLHGKQGEPSGEKKPGGPRQSIARTNFTNKGSGEQLTGKEVVEKYATPALRWKDGEEKNGPTTTWEKKFWAKLFGQINEAGGNQWVAMEETTEEAAS